MDGVGAHVLPTRDGGESRRIRVGEPVRLRDYFLRLGARAEIDADGLVAVDLSEEHELDLAAHLQTWSAINGVEVVIEQTPVPDAAPLAPLFAERPRLGSLLVDKGLITAEQLAEGLAESRSSGELLGRILLRRQWLFEDELARTLATQLDLPYVNLRVAGVDLALARRIPVETGIRIAAIPVGYFRDRIRVAFADPCDEQAQEVVERHVANAEVVVAELSDIESAWRRIGYADSATGLW